MMDKLLSVKEAAGFLGVSVGTVRSYIKRKLLKASQFGSNKRGRNEYRIRFEDINKCLKSDEK